MKSRNRATIGISVVAAALLLLSLFLNWAFVSWDVASLSPLQESGSATDLSGWQ